MHLRWALSEWWMRLYGKRQQNLLNSSRNIGRADGSTEIGKRQEAVWVASIEISCSV